MRIIELEVSTTVMDLVAVFAVVALFVFMLALLCFCVLPFSSVNKDLYIGPKLILPSFKNTVLVRTNAMKQTAPAVLH